MVFKSTIICLIAIVVSACASTNNIKKPIKNSPSVNLAKDQKYIGELVRWGGVIIDIKHAQNKTILEIVERPISRHGVPKPAYKSKGRFLAITEEFIDPENVKKDQYITIVGQIQNHQKGTIGGYDYLYPVVHINEYKVWNRKYSDRYRPRWRHDPFWYPYYYDPFWRPYRHYLHPNHYHPHH